MITEYTRLKKSFYNHLNRECRGKNVRVHLIMYNRVFEFKSKKRKLIFGRRCFVDEYYVVFRAVNYILKNTFE